jgi:ribosome-binding protein aMBF1 (putative translation factor)
MDLPKPTNKIDIDYQNIITDMKEKIEHQQKALSDHEMDKDRVVKETEDTEMKEDIDREDALQIKLKALENENAV